MRVGWSVTRGGGQRVAAPAPGKKARCRGRRSRCCRCSSDRDGDEGVVGRDQRGRREKWPGCSRFLSAGSLGAPRAERICFSIAVRRNLPFLVPPNSIARARHSPLLSSFLRPLATRIDRRTSHARWPSLDRALDRRCADSLGMRLQVEIPIVRSKNEDGERGVAVVFACGSIYLYTGLGRKGAGGGGRGVGTISADACCMRSESFYPVQRFLRDSFVRYHRVQRTAEAETKQGRGT